MKTKRFLVLFLSFLFVSLSIFGQDIPQPKQGRLIHDFAGIIPDGIESRLEQNLLSYEKSTTIEMTVVTVSSLDGYEIEDYSIKMANSWKIGKKSNNGLLLLVAPNERKWRIEVGYALEPYITDYDAKYIGDSNFPEFFREEKYGEGIEAGMLALQKELGSDSWQIREEERVRAEKERARKAEELGQVLFVLMIILLILAGIATVIYFIYRAFQRAREERIEAEKVFKEVQSTYKDHLAQTNRMKNEGFNNADKVVTALTGEVQPEVKKFVDSAVKNSAGIINGNKLIQRIKSVTNNLFAEGTDRTVALATLRTMPNKLKGLGELMKDAKKSLETLKEEAPHKIWSNYEKVESGVQEGVADIDAILEKTKKLSSMEVQKFSESRGHAENAERKFSALTNILHGITTKKNEWEKAKEKFKKSGISKSEKEKIEKKGTKDGVVDWLLIAALVSSAESAKAETSSYSHRTSHNDDSSSSSSSSFSGFGGGSFGGGGASGSW